MIWREVPVWEVPKSHQGGHILPTFQHLRPYQICPCPWNSLALVPQRPGCDRRWAIKGPCRGASSLVDFGFVELFLKCAGKMYYNIANMHISSYILTSLKMAHFPNYLKWISFHLQGITLKSYLGSNYWSCPGRRCLKKKTVCSESSTPHSLSNTYVYTYSFNVYKKQEEHFLTKLGSLCNPLSFLGISKLRIAP